MKRGIHHFQRIVRARKRRDFEVFKKEFIKLLAQPSIMCSEVPGVTPMDGQEGAVFHLKEKFTGTCYHFKN